MTSPSGLFVLSSPGKKKVPVSLKRKDIILYDTRKQKGS
jgi:hypothetical protein